MKYEVKYKFNHRRFLSVFWDGLRTLTSAGFGLFLGGGGEVGVLLVSSFGLPLDTCTPCSRRRTHTSGVVGMGTAHAASQRRNFNIKQVCPTEECGVNSFLKQQQWIPDRRHVWQPSSHIQVFLLLRFWIFQRFSHSIPAVETCWWSTRAKQLKVTGNSLLIRGI